MPRFDPNKFRAGRWWDLGSLWGGGHTVDTDPSRLGWRAAQAGGDPDVVLVGIRGEPGCFSARPLGSDRVDVAVYFDETPEEVREAWSRGEAVDAKYVVLPLISGWGLEALDVLRGRRSQAGGSLEKWFA